MTVPGWGRASPDSPIAESMGAQRHCGPVKIKDLQVPSCSALSLPNSEKYFHAHVKHAGSASVERFLSRPFRVTLPFPRRTPSRVSPHVNVELVDLLPQMIFTSLKEKTAN